MRLIGVDVADEFELYDLKVEVVAGEKPFVCRQERAEESGAGRVQQAAGSFHLQHRRPGTERPLPGNRGDDP